MVSAIKTGRPNVFDDHVYVYTGCPVKRYSNFGIRYCSVDKEKIMGGIFHEDRSSCRILKIKVKNFQKNRNFFPIFKSGLEKYSRCSFEYHFFKVRMLLYLKKKKESLP